MHGPGLSWVQEKGSEDAFRVSFADRTEAFGEVFLARVYGEPN